MRRTPLKRTAMKRRPTRRPAMTPEQYETVMNRSGGRCEGQIPGVCTGSAEEWHHRRRRGVGVDPHAASNGAALCRACHHEITHVSPAVGRERGLIVSALGVMEPAEVPMLVQGRWWLLDDEGGMSPTIAPTMRGAHRG